MISRHYRKLLVIVAMARTFFPPKKLRGVRGVLTSKIYLCVIIMAGSKETHIWEFIILRFLIDKDMNTDPEMKVHDNTQ